MTSIGERLRQERLRQGLSLSKLSERTKIRCGLLEAIEADDFDQLPGEFFARAFVRQYAHVLGLEESEIEAMVAQRFGAPPVAEEAAPARPAQEVGEPALPWAGDLLRNAVMAAAGFAAVVLAGVALYFWWPGVRGAAEVKPPPVVVRPSPPPEPAPAQPPVVTPAPAPATVEAAAPASPPEAAAAQAPPPSSPVETPPLAPVPESPVVVGLGASRPAWVRVTADGVVVYEGTLQPGAARTFKGAESVRVFTGNAGGLEIQLNGKPIGPVGPEGQVRVVELTAAGPTITAPKPRTAEPGTP